MAVPGESREIFRAEAVAAYRTRFQGEAPAPYPLSLSRISWGLFALVAGLAAFLAFGNYTESIKSLGVVRPSSGYVVLKAGQDGIVQLAPTVQQGTTLENGALIASIAATPAVEALTSLSDRGIADLAHKRDSLIAADRINVTSIQGRLSTLRDQEAFTTTQLQNVEKQRLLVMQRLDLKLKDLERAQNLEKEGYVSSQYLSGAKIDVAAMQASVAEMDQRSASTSQQVSSIRQQYIELKNRADIDSERTRQDVAEIESRISTALGNRRTEVRATGQVLVSAVHVDSGSQVTSDTPIVTVTNSNAPKEIRCMVEARAAVGLRVGATVKLRYSAFPFQYFGVFDGQVLSIDTSPWQGPEGEYLRGAKPLDTNPVYRVLVRPSTQSIPTPQGPQFLLAGMTVDVEIPKVKRSLAAWLFEPMRNY